MFLQQAAYVREAVDARLREKIEQLTLSGVRKMTEMKHHLNTFVVEELFYGEQTLLLLAGSIA